MFNSALDALYACRNHWSWLYITGSANKNSYTPSLNWLFQCACCEYTGHTGNGTNDLGDYVCDNCPLTRYAWDFNDDSLAAPCDVYHTNSLFINWISRSNMFNGNSVELRKCAYHMVQACNRAIEDILMRI